MPSGMNPPHTGTIAGLPFFCSWSGGKDSCLALYHAIRREGDPRCLLTMMAEDGRASRSHALPRSLLEAQARRLNLPIVFGSASWESYEAVFSAALRTFKAEGIERGVFGDIDIDAHRDWCRRVCGAAGLEARHPLWKRERRELLEEFIDLGFTAVIVVTQADRLGPEWLGRTIDRDTVPELERAGIDPSGELGEYHTVVTGGPIFRSRIRLKTRKPVLHDGYWFLRVSGTRGEEPKG
jgi:diphthine-ammonia ligase